MEIKIKVKIELKIEIKIEVKILIKIVFSPYELSNLAADGLYGSRRPYTASTERE